MANGALAAIRAGVEEGLTASQIGERIGLTKRAVYWYAAAGGVEARNGKNWPRVSLREAVQDMRLPDALEFVIEAYEAIAGADADEIEYGRMLGLTGGEAVVFGFLLKRAGRSVPRRALHDALDHARGGEVKSEKLLDVYICKIRRKLAGRWAIHTIWGFGFRMEPV